MIHRSANHNSMTLCLAAGFCDMATGVFSDAATLKAMFESAGATPDRKIVNYCGGGISATLGFFAQKALGYEDLALYDASMQEWGKDESLPMLHSQPHLLVARFFSPASIRFLTDQSSLAHSSWSSQHQ